MQRRIICTYSFIYKLCLDFQIFSPQQRSNCAHCMYPRHSTNSRHRRHLDYFRRDFQDFRHFHNFRYRGRQVKSAKGTQYGEVPLKSERRGWAGYCLIMSSLYPWCVGVIRWNPPNCHSYRLCLMLVVRTLGVTLYCWFDRLDIGYNLIAVHCGCSYLVKADD